MNGLRPRPLEMPDGYRGVVADTDFLGHLTVMEMLSLPPGVERPWKRAVVIDDPNADLAGASAEELATVPSIPAEEFEQHWQQLVSRLESGWINIVPTAVYNDTLMVTIEYRVPRGMESPLPPDRIGIPGHTLPRKYLPPELQARFH